MEIMMPGGMLTLTKPETEMVLASLRAVTDDLIKIKHPHAVDFIQLHNKLDMNKQTHYQPVYFPLIVRVRRRKKGKVPRGKRRAKR